ncbi:MAG: hypothetical protein KF708_22780 [Pirellulales bacterium]|nr:hypothetical protein [Pirellulales bacterium]
MNETKKDVHNNLCRAIAAKLDFTMEDKGFSRDRNSLDYIRRCDAGEQLLQIHFTFKPALDSRANAHIYPWLRLKFPEVNRVASEIVGGQHGAIGTTDITLAQPVDFVIPKKAHIYWFTYGREDDYVLCVRSIQGYIEKWIIPFLDDYTTVASLTHFYESKDERIPAQRHFYIYVAAAYILLGQPAKAMEVLETKFGRPGSRRDYAKAFEYVERLLK